MDKVQKAGHWLVAGLIVGGLAWAQSGFGLSGKLLGYREQPAELWAEFAASGDVEDAVRIGTVQADGQFRLELPATVPEELLLPPQVNEACGEVTPGLKLAVFTEIFVKRDNVVLGAANFANRRADIETLLLGRLEGSNKVGFWFYANRAGSIREDCDSPTSQQTTRVTFQPGWNALTGFVMAGEGKSRTRIDNGHQVGLLGWFYIPTRQ
jgi:hypothetical protein